MTGGSRALDLTVGTKEEGQHNERKEYTASAVAGKGKGSKKEKGEVQPAAGIGFINGESLSGSGGGGRGGQGNNQKNGLKKKVVHPPAAHVVLGKNRCRSLPLNDGERKAAGREEVSGGKKRVKDAPEKGAVDGTTNTKKEDSKKK